MLNAGAAQNQPEEKALPSLISGVSKSPDDHIFAARNVNPTADLVTRAATHETKQIPHARTTTPDRIIKRRMEAIDHLRKIADRCKIEHEACQRTHPGGLTSD